MDLRQLRYALAVADRGSFTRAAAALHVSQPALSLAIAKLEAELGARLFDRADRFVRPTDAGERLIARARTILALADQAKREAKDGAAARNVVRLGAPALVAAAWLPDVLTSFLRAQPGAEVALTIGGARDVERAVAAGELDLGLFSAYQPSAQVTVTPLFDAPLALAVAETHPFARRRRVAWPDVLGERLVLFPRGYYQRDLIEAQAERHRATLEVVAETDALSVVKAVIRARLAVGVLLRLSIGVDEGLKAVAFDPPEQVRMSAALRRGRERRPAVEALMAVLQTRVPKT